MALCHTRCKHKLKFLLSPPYDLSYMVIQHMDATTKRKRTVKERICFRPGPLSPLIQKWMDVNPHLDVTVLILRALRECDEVREVAGKRHAHLVEAE
jgi:hypothetical protein